MPKTILITGAATGFGRDMAETLTREGHHVFAAMRDITGRNRAAAEALRKMKIDVAELDVANDASVEAGMGVVIKACDNALDVVVNNAGIASFGISEGFTSDQVRELYNTNVVGVHRVMRAALPAMRKKGEGLFVNISSIVARVSFPFFSLYNGTKAAVEAISEGYRYELSQLGIEVVLVEPSAYPTNLFAAMRQPADAARVQEYGSVSEIPNQMGANFQAMFAGANAPKPHYVADAVSKLINLPKGKRPLRTVVGTSFGAEKVNAAVAPIQAQTLEALGLAHLARISGAH